MTNVMRCWTKQQYQLENDSPHWVATRVAHDLHTFLRRRDVRTNVATGVIQRHLASLQAGTYTECAIPGPPEPPEPIVPDISVEVEEDKEEEEEEDEEEESQ
jgi:hypothetical protein